MSKFRFGIMGAADIANKFCNAVSFIEDATVVAVSSRNMDRAKAFADKNGIPNAYDDYEAMLIQEKPDAVYIAVTTNAHYDMCMLCLKHNIPFLCEKTMCVSLEQTKEVFRVAEEKGVFGMEAMWSRFLPPILKVKEWMKDGRIGEIHFADINVGFQPTVDFSNRFYNKALGGGAAFDLTVYCYEIMTFLMEEPILEMQTMSAWAESDVDVTNVITLRYKNALACLKGSINAHLEEKMMICGENGNIMVPSPHFAHEAYLYDKGGNVVEHYVDYETPNGFIYEIKETMDCVRAGKIQSDVVPHSITIEFAEVCEKLLSKR